MKLRKVIRELKDATCTRVSLVDKGANRIGWRVMKREQTGATEMSGLDLASNPFRHMLSRKNEKPAPEIAAFVFPTKPSDAELPRLIEVVGKSGFKTDDAVTNDDGTFMLRQSDFDIKDEADVRVVALNPNLAMIVKGFSPWADSLGEFEEVMSGQSFFSGLGNACSALSQTISTKMQSASDPKEAATGVADVLKSFSTYVSHLASALPVAAFKFEKDYVTLETTFKTERETAKKAEADAEKAKADAEALAKKAMKPDGMDQAKWDAMTPEEQAAACAPPAKKAEDAVVEPAAKEPVVAAAPAVDVAAIVKAVSDSLRGDLAGITDSVAKVSATVTAQGETLTQLTTKSADLEKKLGGTVLGAAKDDQTPRIPTQKSVRGPGAFGGSTDTAHAPPRERW